MVHFPNSLGMLWNRLADKMARIQQIVYQGKRKERNNSDDFVSRDSALCHGGLSDYVAIWLWLNDNRDMERLCAFVFGYVPLVVAGCLLVWLCAVIPSVVSWFVALCYRMAVCLWICTWWHRCVMNVYGAPKTRMNERRKRSWISIARILIRIKRTRRSQRCHWNSRQKEPKLTDSRATVVGTLVIIHGKN